MIALFNRALSGTQTPALVKKASLNGILNEA
jgi:hypothetical protein